MRRVLGAAALALGLLAPSADAGELGAFLTWPTPTEKWGTGFGFNAFVFSLPFLQAGVEFARVAGEGSQISFETYTAQVEFSPPMLKISPFIGLGAGGYRQKVGSASDWGTSTAIYGGLRVPIGPARLRAEFRKVSLSGDHRGDVDKRVSIGIGFPF